MQIPGYKSTPFVSLDVLSWERSTYSQENTVITVISPPGNPYLVPNIFFADSFTTSVIVYTCRTASIPKRGFWKKNDPLNSFLTGQLSYCLCTVTLGEAPLWRCDCVELFTCSTPRNPVQYNAQRNGLSLMPAAELATKWSTITFCIIYLRS